MQYAVLVAAFVTGAFIGVLVMWMALREKYVSHAVERKHSAKIQRLEKQLHAQECECLDRLNMQKRELLGAHEAELTQAVAAARDRQQTELDAQLKAFAVNVSPYVDVSETGNYWRRRHKSVTGYQYQLLVNGIPAFAPHIVEEKVETSETVDEQRLIQLASQAAEAAVACYVGGASRIFALAAPVLKGLGQAKAPRDASQAHPAGGQQR